VKKHIWIEAEHWAEGEWDIYDDNLDVIVTFTDRSRWIASFFTYQNIQRLREKNQQTGECMSGTFFKASDMVLIDIVSRERIEQVIEYAIENEEFTFLFSRISDAEPDDDDLYPQDFFNNQ
jgi:hypothetical protein